MTFVPPAQGARGSTETSDLLADFLNSDTDGTVIIVFAITVDGQQAIVRSSEHSAGGTLIEGETGPAVSAFDPQPGKGSTVSLELSDLCWTNPDPNVAETTITCDVYFGTGEPNELLPGFGYELISPPGTEETCVTLENALEQFQTYYWVVDCYDTSRSAEEEFLPGTLWSFNTNNEAPAVSVGQDQYVWLGNADDADSATVVIDATATDDGLPADTLTLSWAQTDAGPEVIIDPADVEDITLVISEAGTYQFQLTANDGDADTSATVQVIVAETPCLAAQAMPGYQQITGDFDNNCIVDFGDLAELAVHWLECSSLLCP